MSTEPKMTPWFRGRDVSPTEPGIYNMSCRDYCQSGTWYSHFDGERWSCWETVERAGSWSKLVRIVSRKKATRSQRHFAYDSTNWTWRGLAEKPKGN